MRSFGTTTLATEKISRIKIISNIQYAIQYLDSSISLCAASERSYVFADFDWLDRGILDKSGICDKIVFDFEDLEDS